MREKRRKKGARGDSCQLVSHGFATTTSVVGGRHRATTARPWETRFRNASRVPSGGEGLLDAPPQKMRERDTARVEINDRASIALGALRPSDLVLTEGGRLRPGRVPRAHRRGVRKEAES